MNDRHIWQCPACKADNQVPETNGSFPRERHHHGVMMPATLTCRKCVRVCVPSEITVTGKH